MAAAQTAFDKAEGKRIWSKVRPYMVDSRSFPLVEYQDAERCFFRGGGTLLHLATLRRDVEQVTQFLMDGEVDEPGFLGTTAVHEAAQCGHNEILERLIQAGSDLDRRDIDGATALIQAARCKNYVGVGMLRRAGADATVRDAAGHDVWWYAWKDARLHEALSVDDRDSIWCHLCNRQGGVDHEKSQLHKKHQQQKDWCSKSKFCIYWGKKRHCAKVKWSRCPFNGACQECCWCECPLDEEEQKEPCLDSILCKKRKASMDASFSATPSQTLASVGSQDRAHPQELAALQGLGLTDEQAAAAIRILRSQEAVPQARHDRADESIALHADEDDVMIGRALDSEGQDLPLDEVLRRLRGQIVATCKVEPPELVTVCCDDLFYTQKGCSDRFRGGRYLEDTIQALLNGSVDPQRDEWLVLEVVKKDGRLLSNDNRRLYCLKEYQRRRLEPGKVMVRIRVFYWDSAWNSFQRHHDTKNGGTEIFVRQRR